MAQAEPEPRALHNFDVAFQLWCRGAVAACSRRHIRTAPQPTAPDPCPQRRRLLLQPGQSPCRRIADELKERPPDNHAGALCSGARRLESPQGATKQRPIQVIPSATQCWSRSGRCLCEGHEVAGISRHLPGIGAHAQIRLDDMIDKPEVQEFGHRRVQSDQLWSRRRADHGWRRGARRLRDGGDGSLRRRGGVRGGRPQPGSGGALGAALLALSAAQGPSGRLACCRP